MPPINAHTQSIGFQEINDRIYLELNAWVAIHLSGRKAVQVYDDLVESGFFLIAWQCAVPKLQPRQSSLEATDYHVRAHPTEFRYQ